MKRASLFLGTLFLFLALTASANTTPTITASSPISLNQGDPATSTIVATVSDAEDSAGSLTVTAITVPSGITVSSISNGGGTINAVITAACDAASGENDVVFQVVDSGGATANATFQVFVRSTLPPGFPVVTAATNGTGTNDQACSEQPLTLTASAPNATSYQWYVDGSPISGATGTTYVATSAGTYSATASNECATSSQSVINVTVQNPTPHRANLMVLSGSTSFCSGGSVTLWSDSATGIQWYKDGVAISGANNESYVATASGSYTVILNALGCHTSASDPIVVTVSNAPQAFTITANTNGTGTNDQACPEQPLNLFAHDPGNSSLTNLQWYLGNDAIDGATSNQYSATAAGDYTIVATLNGCSTSSAVYTVQNPTPHKPTISVLSDSTTICTNPGGYGVLLESDSATGIQWYNGTFPISGANNQQLLATETGSYSVILNALGCHSEQSDPVFITVNTAPETPTITATENATGTSDQACPDVPLVLTANDSNPNTTTYQWHVNNETIDGATDKTYSATRSGDFTVVATSAEGCSMTSAIYTVQNPTPHSPFISFRNQDSSVTTLEVCQGTSVTIDSDSATGIHWWKDGVDLGPGGQSLTVTQSGTYTAQLNALGCHSQFGRNVTVTVDALPSTPTITGATNATGTQDQACPEQPLTLTASSSGAVSYQWYSDNAPVGDGTNTLVVTAAGNYSVTATNAACTTSRSATYVVQNPTPHSPFISFRSQDSSVTTLEVCSGTAVIIDSDSATGIQWYKDGVAIPGAVSQSYTATQSGTYTAQLDALGCHSQFGRNVTLTVDAMPTTPTISGATNGTGTQDQACPEQPLTLTASSAGAQSYQWYSDNAPVGDGTAALTVTAAGNYSVTATNGTCTTSRSATYVVQNPTPHSAFLSFRGQSSSVTSITICQGSSVIIDSDSLTGIVWYKDGVAISGTHLFLTVTEAGVYTAQLNALGCHSQFSRNMTVSVDAMPSTPAISGVTNGTGTQDQACPEQPLTLTASSNGAVSYQWYSDNAPVGDGTATLTVTAAGNYSVTATNGTCTTSRSATYVVQNPTPHRATLSVISGSATFCQGGSVTLWSDSATGIQWYKDGAAISGANSESYLATAAGSYTVILNALGCHSSESDPIIVTVNSNPSATITAPSLVISSSTGNAASVPSAGTGATYVWSITNGTITSGSGTNAITFTAGTAGTLTLSATVTTSAGCSDTKSASVTVADPVTVKSVKPTAGSASGGDVITIKGTGFLTGATVTFGGVAATNVTVDSATKILATTPAHASGVVDVVVTNSNTVSGTLTGGFTYKKK